MKFLFIAVTLLATTWAQSFSGEYLPPVEEYSGASSNAVETNFLENEPAHSLADDGYRYKTVKRFRLRHRRDVSELSNNYLPPHAASAPAPVYSQVVETAPAPVYAAPAVETFEVEASEPAPAHSFGDDGYRYRSVKRYRLRRRRDVSELSNSYLPPHAASAPGPVYSAPAETASVPVYSAPAAAAETYEVEASEPAPAHSFGDDGYRYRSVKRYRLRRRRDVSELSNSYLPPHAASAPGPVYSVPAESASVPVYSAPAPAAETYEVEASEPAPAHSFGDDGYRYRSIKRYRLRHRRDVSELSNSYLPPHAASAPEPVYSVPAETASVPVYSAPAPAAETYEVEASEPAPAHSFGDDGYRYRSVKRYRLRRRRDVNELSNDYLPPQAASAPASVYSVPAETAAVPVYSAPSVETYEVQASDPAPAHSFGDDGYRYKAVKRYRLRHRH